MIRTDLAMEAVELRGKGAQAVGALEGVSLREFDRNGIPVTEVKVLDEQGAQSLGKPVGTYLTLTLGQLPGRTGDAFSRTVQAVAEELRGLLPEDKTGKLPALVIGLGNRDITPDAVGPIAVDCTLATRHLIQQAAEYFGDYRPVSAVATGVVGSTGVESAELIRALVREIDPGVVIAIDALASRSAQRLGKTIQIADTGITPGSGVGNARAELNEATLGVPVIALGVPTVVDAGTLVADLAGGALDTDQELERMMVTPREIDTLAADTGKVVGYGVRAGSGRFGAVTELRRFTNPSHCGHDFALILLYSTIEARDNRFETLSFLLFSFSFFFFKKTSGPPGLDVFLSLPKAEKRPRLCRRGLFERIMGGQSSVSSSNWIFSIFFPSSGVKESRPHRCSTTPIKAQKAAKTPAMPIMVRIKCFMIIPPEDRVVG